jgi:hypothetical protein
MFFVFIYENRRTKSAEIVLRWRGEGEREKREKDGGGKSN